MNFARLCTVSALALSYLTCVTCWGAEEVDRIRGWQADLDAIEHCLKTKHKNAFFKLDRKAFDSAVAQLRQTIPASSDHEILVKFVKLAALLQDGHTRIYPSGPKFGFRRYPVSFVWASDGLFVDAVTEDHRDLLKAQVMGVGSLSLSEALDQIATLHAADSSASPPQFYHSPSCGGRIDHWVLESRNLVQ